MQTIFLLTQLFTSAIIIPNNISKTVDAKIKTKIALSESLGCWKPNSTQFVKWVAEGAVKNSFLLLSILQRKTYVSCRKYDSISQSVQLL